LKLITLDLSENLFSDLNVVCATLSNINTLEHLVIDLSDENEVDIVLSNLQSLKTLNEREVNDSDAFVVVFFSENQGDLEEIADIYDALRDKLKNINCGNDDEYSNIFDNFSKQIIFDIRAAASAGHQLINFVVNENKLKM
jgi:hypothetical protein